MPKGQYYPVGQPISLKLYQEGTFRKLTTEGRRLPTNPLALSLGWPAKFHWHMGGRSLDFSRLSSR